MAIDQPGRPGRTTSRTRGPARPAGRARIPSTGFRSFAGRGGGREAAAPAGELRRPLQPGAAVLRQPDAGRAAAHRRRVRLRAEQGRAARHPRADGRRTCATSTRTSPSRSPTGSGCDELPERSEPAADADHRPARRRRRSASSRTAPTRFAGRKIGVLVTDGADAALLERAAGGGRRPRARWSSSSRPTVGGVDRRATARSSRRSRRSAAARRCSTTRSRSLRRRTRARRARPATPAAQDFVTDAYAHCKFIGYVAAAAPLLEAAGVADRVDDGFVALDGDGAGQFVERCRDLRFWDRELLVPATR